jgi:hypothetical protein
MRSGSVPNLIDLAEHHHVSGYAYQALRRSTVMPAEVVRLVEALHSEVVAGSVLQLRVQDDLRFMAAALNCAEVPWLLIKGPVLAHLLYPKPALRPSRDLDVVLPRVHFVRGINALERTGARMLDANWDLLTRERRGQLHMLLPGGTTVDVHWHLINAGRVRDTLNVPMDALWQRGRAVVVRDLTVATLEPTDNLLYLALHAGLAGAGRLRWLNDLALAIEVEPPDWHALVARAHEWRVARLVGVTLTRADRLVGANVPLDALDALVGSTVGRRAVDVADWLAAPMHSAGAELWPQLVRDSWGDTVRTIWWRLRRRLGNTVDRAARDRLLPEVMMPSGGHRGRSSYVHAVIDGQR